MSQECALEISNKVTQAMPVIAFFDHPQESNVFPIVSMILNDGDPVGVILLMLMYSGEQNALSMGQRTKPCKELMKKTIKQFIIAEIVGRFDNQYFHQSQNIIFQRFVQEICKIMTQARPVMGFNGPQQEQNLLPIASMAQEDGN